jgi:hypothetical protein
MGNGGQTDTIKLMGAYREFAKENVAMRQNRGSKKERGRKETC